MEFENRFRSDSRITVFEGQVCEIMCVVEEWFDTHKRILKCSSELIRLREQYPSLILTPKKWDSQVS